MSVHDARRRILDRRRQEIADEWQSILDDAAHWNSTHPDEPPIIIEPITQAEIDALKAAHGAR